MGPPTSATLIRPDQPLQRQGPFETPNQCDPDRIRPDQPLQRLGPSIPVPLPATLIRPDQPLLTGLSYQNRVVLHLMRRAP